jgi:quercetin dioxygenase-like cupin family protein
MQLYQKFTSKNAARINTCLEAGFLNQQNNPDVRKTHLFEGRYENIYLNEHHIPELTVLIDEAMHLAEKILNVKNLRAGYWFNSMPPGASTTLHTHDDDDELLSGVYYVNVPENSGNLIIYDDHDKNHPERIEIIPQTGQFIFFKPDVRHEVSRNNSNQHRLSIGMNFGLVESE